MENIDTLFIKKRYGGSIEKFKEEYIQALIGNKRLDSLDPRLQECINQYREKLIIGFDITQPNLVAMPGIVRTTLEDGYLINRKIGNFYNQQDINGMIDSQLDEEFKRKIFKKHFGIDEEKKTLREIADDLGMDYNITYNLTTRKYMTQLREQVTQMENNKLDGIARERFIRKYFEKRDIFRDDKEMPEEDKDELIKLYEKELKRVEEEKRKKEERSIKTLNLPNRIYNILNDLRISNIDELYLMIKNNAKIKRLGERGLKEIKLALMARGYTFSDLEPEENIEEQLNKAYAKLFSLEEEVAKIKKLIGQLEKEAKSKETTIPQNFEDSTYSGDGR